MPGKPLYLASASARRKLLLEEAGFTPVVIDSGVDDAELRPGASVADDWTTALAYLKASAGRRRLLREHGPDHQGVVLGADTVVVKNGTVIGQPRDEAHARRIIGLLEDGEHHVVSGVAILSLGPHRDERDSENGATRSRPADRDGEGVQAPGGRKGASGGAGGGRFLFSDVARVRVGRIGADRIDTYLRSGGWRGKAGAYNLSERVADGWPLECEGDPATVMGLPMRRLDASLRQFLGAPESGRMQR